MTQSVSIDISANEASAVRAWLAITRAEEAAAAGLGKIDSTTRTQQPL